MTDPNQDEFITQAINSLTEKLSKVLLQEFLKLATELQLNIVLIKSSQLLLSNILCQVASNIEELKIIVADQGAEIHELTANCAMTGFSDKFNLNRH